MLRYRNAISQSFVMEMSKNKSRRRYCGTSTRKQITVRTAVRKVGGSHKTTFDTFHFWTINCTRSSPLVATMFPKWQVALPTSIRHTICSRSHRRRKPPEKVSDTFKRWFPLRLESSDITHLNVKSLPWERRLHIFFSRRQAPCIHWQLAGWSDLMSRSNERLYPGLCV
jgi:hypothetical protein